MPTPEQFTTVAECGCKYTLVAIPVDSVNVRFDMRVYQCHLHTHAKELLAACEHVLKIVRLQPPVKLGDWDWPQIGDALESVVNQAKGKS